MKRQRGFTLIEVLTAIAVIAILLSMLFLGAKYMTNSAKVNTTRTMLSDLKSMMAEREVASGASKVHTDIDTMFVTDNLVTVVPPMTALDAAAIADVEKGFDTNRYPKNAYAPNAVLSSGYENAVGLTQFVMEYFIAIPSNKSSLANLPPQQFLESTGAAYNPPIILDGYGNPIIAVPSSGLQNVKLNGVATTIVSPDGKPFFASAGPDGDFTKGDDNIYSFN